LNEPELAAAFGLGLRLHFPLPGLPPREPPQPKVVIDVCEVAAEDPLTLFSGAVGEPLWQTIFEGGAAYSVQPGRAGDYLLFYAERPAFHLSTDGLRLSCADPRAQDGEWQRTLLDTVLWTVALLHRGQLLHASAVDSTAGVVAIVADQGSGKSSLAAQLMTDGWPFFTDDILAFEARGEDGVVVQPGPALMNFPVRANSLQSSPDSLGRILARFPGTPSEEAWIEVRTSSERERPLAAIVLLRRGDRTASQVSRVPATPVDIRPHTLGFRDLPGAERRRFEAVSDLVERVPVFCLEASMALTPRELADLLRAELPSSPQSLRMML
jgi:hypothetical protein